MKHKPGPKYANVFLGAIFIVQGVLNLMKGGFGFHFYFGIFQILFGIFFGYYGYGFLSPKARYAPRITLDNDRITMKSDMFSKARSIFLQDIKLLQLKPEQLTVMTKEFDFSHSFHCDTLNKNEIMDTIAEYAMKKNIPVERVPYRNV